MRSPLRIGSAVLLAAFCVPGLFGGGGGSARAEDAANAPPTADGGRTQYIDKGCGLCHGYDGQGALLTGPRLGPEPLPLPAFTAAIRRPRDEMPAYSPAVLSDAEIEQIFSYLESLPPAPDESTLDIFPGR